MAALSVFSNIPPSPNSNSPEFTASTPPKTLRIPPSSEFVTGSGTVHPETLNAPALSSPLVDSFPFFPISVFPVLTKELLTDNLLLSPTTTVPTLLKSASRLALVFPATSK